MAVIVNDPKYAGSSPAPTPNPPPTPESNGVKSEFARDEIARPAASPPSANGGFALTTSTGTPENLKVKGSDGADRSSTLDLLKDSDHIIKLGAGNDVFAFRQDGATNPALRNAVVDMGEGDADHIVLAGSLNDYKVTFRDNGSIKFEFIGDGGDNNAAITFQGAEKFSFRNIDADPNGLSDTYYKGLYDLDLVQLKTAYGLV